MPKHQLQNEMEYVLSLAIRRGVHPRNLGYPCPETIAVFE